MKLNDPYFVVSRDSKTFAPLGLYVGQIEKFNIDSLRVICLYAGNSIKMTFTMNEFLHKDPIFAGANRKNNPDKRMTFKGFSNLTDAKSHIEAVWLDGTANKADSSIAKGWLVELENVIEAGNH